MIIMVESKDGHISTYSDQDIRKKVKEGIDRVRRIYTPKAREDKSGHYILVNREGETVLVVGVVLPDGWRQQINIDL
jgi:hypothetical protein